MQQPEMTDILHSAVSVFQQLTNAGEEHGHGVNDPHNFKVTKTSATTPVCDAITTAWNSLTVHENDLFKLQL